MPLGYSLMKAAVCHLAIHAAFIEPPRSGYLTSHSQYSFPDLNDPADSLPRLYPRTNDKRFIDFNKVTGP